MEAQLEADKNSGPLLANKSRKPEFGKTTCEGETLRAETPDDSSAQSPSFDWIRSPTTPLPSPAKTPDTLMIIDFIDNYEDIAIEVFDAFDYSSEIELSDDETAGTSLRTERNLNKYSNKEYTTGKNKKPKVFINYQCKCLNKCASLIPEEKRKEEFEKFASLGSYKAQLLYIGSCVTEKTTKRSCTMTDVPAEKKKPKQFNRVYSINGVKVCRDMFLKTFQITTQRVTVTLKKLRSGGPVKDCRGIHTRTKNKLPDEDYNFIVDIIEKLPKYESLVKRENNGALYLQPGMTLAKLYGLYRHEYAQKYGVKRKCASFKKMKEIFISKFNLKCPNVKKDNRDICDMFNVKINNAEGSEEKEQAIAEKTRHYERVFYLRNQFYDDHTSATNSPTVECISFHFEKILPLPSIPTTDAFYKRRLWFYMFYIHGACEGNGRGQRYVWVEGEAGRGAQEVGSCLIKYILEELSPTVEHLILWGECCSGQNRNIKIVLMLKAILNSHLTLRTISFRFLHSGDTHFWIHEELSQIETALKRCQRVYMYTAEEYIDIIKDSIKLKYNKICKMQKTDFYSARKLEQNIINRKKFTDKSNVNWSHIIEIKIEKDKPFSILMRKTFEEDFKELNIKKKVRGTTRYINESDLCILWPEGKRIAPAKLTDLKSMYSAIPDDCRHVYRTLKSSDDIVDDVDGFGGKLDFDITYIDI